MVARMVARIIVGFAVLSLLSGTFDAPDCSLTPSEFCSAASNTGCR